MSSGRCCSLRGDAYTPHEGPTSANQNKRKLGVFDRKLEGSHSMFYCHFDIFLEKMKQILEKMKQYCDIDIFSWN